MSIVYNKEVLCPKCGSKETYTVVASWNYMFGEKPAPKNKCSKCGTKLNPPEPTYISCKLPLNIK